MLDTVHSPLPIMPGVYLRAVARTGAFWSAADSSVH